MLRVSLGGEIATRLQLLNDGLADQLVTGLPLDDHSAQQCAVAMQRSAESNRQFDKGSVQLAVLRVAPQECHSWSFGRAWHSGRVDPNDIGRAHVDRPFSTIKRLSGRKDEIWSRINLYVGDIDAALGGGNMHFTGWLRQKEPGGIHILAASGSSL